MRDANVAVLSIIQVKKSPQTGQTCPGVRLLERHGYVLVAWTTFRLEAD